MSIKLGATLFCYGTEYARFQYDFEECVRQTALAGAEGYEIVATQMNPSYPNVSDEFLGLITRLKDTYGIGPVCYGTNNDRGMRPDRDLTDDEMLADVLIDLKAANKLGCKIMRIQYMLSPECYERIIPYAELYDIKCGVEIHNPETPLSDNMKRYLEVIERTGTKHMGFVPDCGCFAIAPNKPKWDKALEAGVREEHLIMAKELKLAGVSQKEATEKLLAAGADPMIMDTVAGMYGFVQFRAKEKLPGLLEELKAVLPYSFEIHGKFHYLNENCVEPSIPYREIFECLKENHYDGYVISEYEDELYCGGTEFTKRHLEMGRNLLGV